MSIEQSLKFWLRDGCYKDTTGCAAKSGSGLRDKIVQMQINPGEMSRIVRENLAAVREKIAAAAARSGRTPEQIELIGVTKYVGSDVARQLVAAGLDHLAESRPQELWRKADSLAAPGVRWHLIGHLQRNKVKRTLPLVTCIHSVDSLKLLQEISKHAAARSVPAAVLLEVNISGDASKTGLNPHDVEPLFPEIIKLHSVSVRGLMTMASLDGAPDRARRDFAALRELSHRLKNRCSHNIVMNELSMGMSGDYEVAIEEGATLVRVGSALFAGLPETPAETLGE